MSEMAVDRAERGRAVVYVAEINAAIVRAARARRHAPAGIRGAREGGSPAGPIAGARVSGKVLDRSAGGGAAGPAGPHERDMAVRISLPRIVAQLGADDPRRQAALVMLHLAERLGPVRGRGLAATLTNSGPLDGLAGASVKIVARWKIIEAAVNGWEIEPGGKVQRGRQRYALTVGRQTGSLADIPLFVALVAMCCDGKSGTDIMRAYGWTPKAGTAKRFSVAMLAALNDVAGALGLGRAS